jgi:GTP pyrophosphokinase
LPLAPSVLREAHEVFAPLANRLGIWQIKWELEDLSSASQEPDTYRQIAGLLDEKRSEREAALEQRRAEIETALRAQGIEAAVSGRPKHITASCARCAASSWTSSTCSTCARCASSWPAWPTATPRWTGCTSTSRPCPASSTTTSPSPRSTATSRCTPWCATPMAGLEIQIRTRAMHEHAEHGVAAHWAYKEAGAKGYAGVSAASQYDAKIAVLRQLLAWERDLSGAAQHGLLDDRIYVLTPEAAVVELPAGATPVDFAYTVHTDLGHRCRGARVDGAMVPLNTALKNGQTVEITAAKEGGPSRDWLNAELGYLAPAAPRPRCAPGSTPSTRARPSPAAARWSRSCCSAKAAPRWRWTSWPPAWASRRPRRCSRPWARTSCRCAASPPPCIRPSRARRRRPAAAAQGPGRGAAACWWWAGLAADPARALLQAGAARPIAGYVTRGRGVSVHRSDCPSFRDLQARDPERVIEVAWSTPATGRAPAYPVDVSVEAVDRQGLLRDISDVFAREKMNVIGVQTQSVKGWAQMTFTVEVADTGRLAQVLRGVQDVAGVRRARRK